MLKIIIYLCIGFKIQMRPKIQNLGDLAKYRYMSEIKKGYGVIVIDCESDEEGRHCHRCRHDYPNLRTAVIAAQGIIRTLGAMHGMGVENQRDRIMAYHQKGDKEGLGAYIAEIYDNEGTRIEDIWGQTQERAILRQESREKSNYSNKRPGGGVS